jgi:hypothetical protein
LEPEEITGPGGLLSQLAGRVIETVLGAELTEHLGYPPRAPSAGPNVRDGSTAKTLQTVWGGPRPVRDTNTPSAISSSRAGKRRLARRTAPPAPA